VGPPLNLDPVRPMQAECLCHAHAEREYKMHKVAKWHRLAIIVLWENWGRFTQTNAPTKNAISYDVNAVIRRMLRSHGSNLFKAARDKKSEDFGTNSFVPPLHQKIQKCGKWYLLSVWFWNRLHNEREEARAQAAAAATTMAVIFTEIWGAFTNAK
jgi:hypothetical protein